MPRLFKWFAILPLIAGAAYAQISALPSLIFVVADPAGACSNAQPVQWNYLSGNLFGCKNSVWTNIGASGATTGASSVGLVMPSSFCSVTNSPVTTTGNLTCTYATSQTANQVIGTSSGGTVALMALTGAQLPNPSSSTLGGVQSLAAVSHQWVNTISTSGVPSATQPAFSDISGTTTASQLPTNQTIRNIQVTFDGGGVALSGSATRCTHVNYGGTIQSATLVSDVSGNATVDVKTVAYTSYTGPASASSITAAAIPALASAVKFQDTTLTGWSTTVTANSDFCFALSSPATVTWVQATLKVAAN